MSDWKSVCLGIFLIYGLVVPARGANSAVPKVSDVVTTAMLAPKGDYYQATVPDTLDLAERASLAVHGLTAFLDHENNYAPWGHFALDSPTPALLDRPGGPPNWGKTAEATTKARIMSGSTEGLSAQLRSIKGMLDYLPPGAVPTHGYVPEARAMLALTMIYQCYPTPALRELIVAYGEAFKKAVKNEGDVSYLYKAQDQPPPTYYSSSQYINGTSARALTIWGQVDHDPSYVALAGRLTRSLMNDKRIWTTEGEHKAMVETDRGHYRGHMHAIVSGLMGMIYAAEANHDAQLMEFTRNAYEYQRNFGIARVGLLGEGCTIGDMAQTAIKLSEAGVGDYWDDVDCYVRNHLTEIQLTDPKLLHQVTSTLDGTYMEDIFPLKKFPARDTTNMIERVIGTYTDDATHLTKTPQLSLVSVACAYGNIPAGIYLAWEAIVRCKDGNAQVNLLLNRASPWLDIDSYLPYEGKVVIKNKTARRLTVRIPRWVDKNAVQSAVSRRGFHLLPSRAAKPYFIGQYLTFDKIHPKDEIAITFPMVTSVEKYSLKWRINEFWVEATECPVDFKPPEAWSNSNPIVYTMTFKGNTLVDVSPRDPGKDLPLYQRNAERDGTMAPMKTVLRFVADYWTK